MNLGVKRLKLVLHFAIYVLWLLVTDSAECKTGETKPHIIFILADDLGWHDVSWHNPKAKTPNLESLAKDGIILEQSYVQQLCTPTRSALLTGRYPFTIGRQRGVLRGMQPTGLLLNAKLLPEAMKDAGYSTHAVGKWHVGFCNWFFTPTYRGFDTFYGYYNGAEDHYTKTTEKPNQHVCQGGIQESFLEEECSDEQDSLENTESSSEDESYPVDPTGYDFRNNEDVDFSVNGTYDTTVYSTYIENLLKSRNSDDPMFLYFALQSVHVPLQVPDSYREPFMGIGNENREILLGMSWAMDDAVGTVVNALKTTGHYENSIIIFSSDNGGEVNSGNNWPLRGGKGTLWEGGTRAPGFIHSPLLNKKGFTSNTLMHVTDWYPTLVGLVGGVAPDDTDGYDQWDALTKETESPRNSLVYNIDEVFDAEGNISEISAALRKGEYKLVVGNVGNDTWVFPPEGLNTTEAHHTHGSKEELSEFSTDEHQLFNLIDDPAEKKNLAKTHFLIVQDMLKDLDKELLRLVPPDNPPRDADGNPDNFDGVWSPGWC